MSSDEQVRAGEEDATEIIKEMVELLTILEWGDEDRAGCPFCGMGEGEGHLERCQLETVLTRAGAKQ